MAEIFRPITLSMVGGNGYVLTFSPAVSIMSALAKAECWIRPLGQQSAAPSTPTNPTPSSGSTANYLHMQIDELQTFDSIRLNVTGSGISFNSPNIYYLLVWAVGTGDLVVNSV